MKTLRVIVATLIKKENLEKSRSTTRHGKLTDLPPWSTTLHILAIAAGVLLLVGFVTEMLHRGVASP
jgi:hypothetical protein